MNNLNTKFFLSALIVPAFVAVGLSGCDLPPKDIGDESESNSGSESDSESDGNTDSDSDTAGSASGSGTTGGGGICEPGDMMPADDGCNTCECYDDGSWGCTEIACEPAPCEPGDTRMEDCNSCFCDDEGNWGCTDQECNPGVCTPGDEQPAEDGCNTCFCDDSGAWACTDLACEPDPFDPFATNGVGICEDAVPMDDVTVMSAEVDADYQLTLSVSFSGGCAEHLLGGCWDGEWAESFPVQTNLAIAHDGMMDACDGVLTEPLVLDLTAIVESYISFYGEGGTFFLNLGAFGSVEVSV